MGYEDIINKAKKIESKLVELGAEGRGLHDKITSIEGKFDPKTVKAIRFIATIRNRYIHEDGFELTPDLSESFNDAYEYVMSNIDSKKEEPQSKNSSDTLGEPIRLPSSTWEKIGYGALVVAGAIVYGWLNP